jgi:hypothetical protein
MQLVYRSTTTTDLLRNPSFKFITVSQPDGTFVVGAHRVACLRELPLILKGMRTADGTALVAAVRRKAYEVRIRVLFRPPPPFHPTRMQRTLEILADGNNAPLLEAL